MLPGATGQRFTARDDWRTSQVTREMAALGTLGFQIVVEHAHDDLSGTARAVFHHSATTLDPQRLALPHAKPLIRLFRTGDMERLDPEHPFLDSLAAIANFDALEAWRLRGVTCCLAADCIPAGKPPLFALRSRLVAGIPPKSRAHVDVASAANAAALARIGVPVLSLHSQDTGTIYRMAAKGEPLNHQPPVQTAVLMQQAKDGRLPWDHPFLTARQAVLNLAQLLTTLNDAREHTVITWRNKSDRRQASLLSSASSTARDIAFKHMR